MRGTTWHLLSILLLFGLQACSQQEQSAFEWKNAYTPHYADGFTIMESEGHESTLLIVKNPWQGAKGIEMQTFIQRGDEYPPEGFKGQVVKAGVQRIVALSSTYVGMIDHIGAAERIVGVSGKGFITTPIIANNPDVADIGQDPSYELLASLQPDLVLMYGVNDAESKMTARLQELGIPYIYLGEYLESAPLARTEWLVLIGELLDMRAKATLAFEDIAKRYKVAKRLVETVDKSDYPSVMLHIPWNDAWFLPNRDTYTAKLLHDAGAVPSYPYQGDKENIIIGIEQALLYLEQSDFWINVGQAMNYDDLPAPIRAQAPLIPAIKKNQIYNNNACLTYSGGSDFFEHGIVEPDKILLDLIHIFHPHLLPDHALHYYRQILVN